MCPLNRVKITGRQRRGIIGRYAGPPFTNTLVIMKIISKDNHRMNPDIFDAKIRPS